MSADAATLQTIVAPIIPRLRQDPVTLVPPVRAIVLAWRWQAFSLVCLAVHVALVREVGIACFPLILLCLAAVSRYSSLSGLVMYAQILLYQNVTISIFSDGLSRNGYVILSGTGYAAAVVLAIPPLLRALRTGRPFHNADPTLTKAASYAALAVGVAILYAALGAAVEGPTAGATGLRNATAMLLATIIGMEAGDRWGYRTVATCLAVSMLPGLLLVFAELLDPAWYLAVIDAPAFMNVKYPAGVDAYYYTVQDVIDRATQAPFNTGLLSDLLPGHSYRFGGPNMHSISYGYVLAVTEILLFSLGQGLLAVPLFVLSFLAGVKGAAILVIASLLLYAGWALARNRWALIGAGLLFSAVYVTFGIRSGLASGDFHVIGLIGGINGFLKNPLGHGLGVGGNLSVGNLTLAHWQKFQANGADVGLESAIGVLLYQMGVGSAAIGAALWALVRATPFSDAASARATATDLIPIALCIGFVNGVFQEEAYSPYAMGLLCLLAGVLVANGRRPATVLRPH